MRRMRKGLGKKDEMERGGDATMSGKGGTFGRKRMLGSYKRGGRWASAGRQNLAEKVRDRYADKES